MHGIHDGMMHDIRVVPATTIFRHKYIFYIEPTIIAKISATYTSWSALTDGNIGDGISM